MSSKDFKEKARGILNPVVSSLSSVGVPPILVSIFGLIFSLYGAYVVAKGSLFAGAIWLLVSGLCDVLDGSIARHSGTASRFGAFIDSTLDRVTEFAYFTGLVIYYITRPQGYSVFMVVVVMIALAGSVLVSYTRARLEGLGYDCKVGIMERPERIALLLVGLLLGSKVLAFVLVLLAVGSVFTTLERIGHGYRVTQTDPPGPSEEDALPGTEEAPAAESPPE
jgi:CDP-diacylglycerol--glycerol-3-phosphate 3-phosphatidyltransferase